MSDPIRLAKRVVALTGCSRREADLYIEGGWVTVDGQVIEEPQFMVDTQAVELLPGANPDPIEPATILLHKPEGYDADGGDRPAWKLLRAESRVIEHTEPPQRTLRRHFARLAVPLPLASQASGLLVLTQNHQVLKKLTDDATRIEQEYVVETSGTIVENGLEQLNRGITANGWRLPDCKVSWQSEARLRFAAKDIRAAQIDSMCEAVGLKALAIKRIRIGQLAMSRLQPGYWRYMPDSRRF